MKKVVICGSMKVKDKMLEVKNTLESFSFLVDLPDMGEVNDYSVMTEQEAFEHKSAMIENHLNKIKEGDCILVINEELKGVENYIGANSFLEMGFAFCLGKKIFLLNNIPDQPNKTEIGGMLPVCLGGDVSGIIKNIQP